jgi:predicted N-acetyltransferase YhbS
VVSDEGVRDQRPVQLVVRQSGVDDELAALAATVSSPLRHPGESLVALPSEVHVCAYRDTALIGHVGLVRTALRHAGATVEAAGIGHLLVGPASRGLGLGGMLLRSAAALASDWEVSGELAFCAQELAGFYEAFEFTPAGPEVRVDQPDDAVASLPPGLIAMWRPLGTGPGRIGSFELVGLPF